MEMTRVRDGDGARFLIAGEKDCQRTALACLLARSFAAAGAAQVGCLCQACGCFCNCCFLPLLLLPLCLFVHWTNAGWLLGCLAALCFSLTHLGA